VRARLALRTKLLRCRRTEARKLSLRHSSSADRGEEVSAHIAPGRDGLFNLVRSLPPTLRYEPGLIVAEGDFVIVHGRFSGFAAPANWIAADILRIQDGILIEHWDVIQDEVARDQSKSGRPMFGESFSVYR
jgi:predicted SnoaL-like aldol condensation-catalyzing enzyme